MERTYKISGMKCSGCAETTQKLLSSIQGVTDVKVSLQNQSAEIDMQKPIPNSTFQKALAGTGYVLADA